MTETKQPATQEIHILASQVRTGMILKIGPDLAYPVASTGLPIFADGTVRVRLGLQHLYYPLVLLEKEEVTVLVPEIQHDH